MHWNPLSPQSLSHSPPELSSSWIRCHRIPSTMHEPKSSFERVPVSGDVSAGMAQEWNTIQIFIRCCLARPKFMMFVMVFDHKFPGKQTPQGRPMPQDGVFSSGPWPDVFWIAAQQQSSIINLVVYKILSVATSLSRRVSKKY